jgi:hypothetical protein
MHPRRASSTLVILYLSLALLSGCASEGSIKPAESLDERTGMTVGSLEKPLELVQSGQFAVTPEPHVSFAYLGPVEWDNMGTITYGLWVHLAPANDWQFDDIKAPGTVVLALDDGGRPLKLIDAPPARDARPLSARGLLGTDRLFRARSATLKRMASSARSSSISRPAGTPCASPPHPTRARL